MTDDLDDLFSDDSSEETIEESAETETEAPEPQEEVEEPAETNPETDPVEEAEEAPKPTQESRENFVPLAALLEEREKAKQNKAEADRLQAQIAEFEARKAQANVPDPYDDPAGYNDYLAAQVEDRVAQALAAREQQQAERQFLEARAKAVQDHGEEFVSRLGDWVDDYAANVDPTVGDKAMASGDPVSFLIDLQKRHNSFQAYSENPEEFIRKQALEMGLVPTAPAAVETTQPAPKGPPSLSSASSRDATNASLSLDEAFEAIFR